MSERYWAHSDPEAPNSDLQAVPDTDAPAFPAVGTGVCPVPHRGQPCTYDDGNPRKVGDGLLCCTSHYNGTVRRLEEFPELWELLGDTTRTKARQLGGRTKQDIPPAPSSECLTARAVLEAELLRIERAIHAMNRTPVVSSAVVRAQTRRLMVDTSDAIDDTTAEMRGDEAIIRHPEKVFPPGCSPSPLDLDRTRTEAAARAKRARARLKELRGRYDTLDSQARTGRDVITARAERCVRHLPPLLNDPNVAVDLVVQVEKVWRDVTRVAHPLPEGVRVACPKCGTRVRLRHGGDYDEVWCPGEVEGVDGPEPCGEHGNALWWAAQLGVTADALTEEEAVDWLLNHHRIRVAGATIRDWVRRGKLAASTELRDGKHRTVYHPVPLLDAATTQRPRIGAGA